MFTFQLLRPPFADDMLAWSQVPAISPPAGGVIAANTERFEQRFEL